MKNITMSKNEFKGLKPLDLHSAVISTESELLRFNYNRFDMIIKRLYPFEVDKYDQKITTIETLMKYSDIIPLEFIKPLFFISVDHSILGFTMKYIKGDNLSFILNDSGIDLNDKKYYLQRIGMILEKMKVIRRKSEFKNFFLGDLHEDNFIVDIFSRKIYVVDLDSAKTSSNYSQICRYLSPMALLNQSNKYNFDEYGNVIVDENTDLYCYIIVILNYLYGKNINGISINDFYKFLNYLDTLNVDLNLLRSFELIVLNEDNNINPMNYIDTLTPFQVEMARRKLYKVKK